MVSSSDTTTVPGASSKLDRQWIRTPWLRAYSTRAQLQDAGAGGRHLEHLLEGDDRQLARVGHDPRIGARRRRRRRCRSRRPRRRRRRRARRRWCPSRRGRASSRRAPCSTPWKPATSTIESSSRAAKMRSARTSRMRALVCEVSVTIPAWEPVSEMARWPRSLIAMAHSAQDTRSPVESSMSISRGSGCGETSWASAIRRSVSLPRALRTATTRCPASRLATIRCAARLRRSASATEVPPNFMTTVALSMTSAEG